MIRKRSLLRPLAASLPFLAVFAAPAAPEGLIVTHRIPATLAAEAVQEAVAHCRSQGYNETSVLVDADGVDQAMLRGDNAGVSTIENARAKAFTSAAYKTDQSKLVARAASGAHMSPALTRLPGLILSEGAVVITVGDEVIGAIGASGAPGGEKDEACARAGYDKIKDRLK